MSSSKGSVRLYSFNSGSEIDGIDITSDESVFGLKSDSMVESILNWHRMVKYDVMINRTNNYNFPEISFDDIDKYDFKNKAFIEVIKSPDYVHLYFDFDSMMYYEEKKRKKEMININTLSIHFFLVTVDFSKPREKITSWPSFKTPESTQPHRTVPIPLTKYLQ